MMMQNLPLCIEKSDTLYQNLIKKDELSNIATLFPKMERSFNFRVKLIRPANCVREINGLSVSYPFDKNGRIETVLLGRIPKDENGNIDIFRAPIIYDDNCGYNYVREFEDIDHLIQEIHRISSYLSPNYVHCDEKVNEDEKSEHDELSIYKLNYLYVFITNEFIGAFIRK